MKKLFTLFVFAPLFSGAQIITTFAGSNATNYGGDGGPATAALFNMPAGVAVDAAGNKYVADEGNNRIRMVSAAGVITTLTGDGFSGYYGDGGPASAAEVWAPAGVAVDAAGNVYVADAGNSVIRKINTAGIISTVAGTGSSSGFSGDGGAATAATLYQPSGVAVDGSGNIYIADRGNNRVRMVNSSGIITTFAGSWSFGFSGDGGPATSARLHNPAGVAVDAGGNVYIADEFNARVRMVNTSGVISTIAGNGTFGFGGDGGLAITAELYQPVGVVLDGSGNIYIADQSNNRVRVINTSGIINTLAGSAGGFAGDGGPATAALVHIPAAVAADASGNIFLADRGNDRIREISTAGIITSIAGSGAPGHGDGGPATAAQLNDPTDIAVDAYGNAYISDGGNNAIRKIDVYGIISTVGGNGIGGFTGDGGPATIASINYPNGLVVDNAGNIFFCDDGNRRIRKISTLGIITTIAGTDSGGHYGNGPATSAILNAPQDIGIDLAGNLYFTDANEYIKKITPDGMLIYIAGTGTSGFTGDGGPATAAELNAVSGVVADSAGNLYLADDVNNRVRKVNTAGIISTIAGTGGAGYFGDGGPATAALFHNIDGIAIDHAGNLFISDEENHRIREIDISGTITLIAGNGSTAYSGDGGPATAAGLGFTKTSRPDNMGNLILLKRAIT